jgi:GNAT superfamily N-acetyltransferase
VTDGVRLRVRFPVDDRELSALHDLAFGAAQGEPQAWAERLDRHSVTWVGAFDGEVLVGFVHACWDGGAHAFLLDTVVHPAYQRRGVGRDLVHAATDAAERAGCAWLHVDYEPHLRSFYEDACGFRPTAAGLVSLAGPASPRPT